ncbi:MAG: FecR domain-containing protein [Polyangiales bacterium]
MRSRFVVAFALVAVLSGAARAQELPSEARVSYVRNDVEVVQGGAHRAAVGEWLRRGDQVRTGPASRAEVWLPNGATVALEERSVLVLFASNVPPAPGATPSSVTTLVRGALRVSPATPDPEHAALMPLGTAAGSVRVGRNELRIEATLNGAATRFAVYRGRARCTPPRATTCSGGLRHRRAGRRVGRCPRAARAAGVAPRAAARVLSFGGPVEVSAGFAPSRRARPSQWFVGSRATVTRDLVDARRWCPAARRGGAPARRGSTRARCFR